MRGRVMAFDEHVGLGEIEADDGGRYPFHCTRIADGTRTIDVGAEVTFETTPGHLGRSEASSVSQSSR
ncbi:MAG TPA: cold shock domain-containing protein [Acidimicrobiales bacterium]|nr:cold shock domain-containing protein [Acidimicrobiales bacterium]